jgi:hypothetical protein
MSSGSIKIKLMILPMTSDSNRVTNFQILYYLGT